MRRRRERWEAALRDALRTARREALRHLLKPGDVVDLDFMFFRMDESRHLGDPQQRVDAAVLDVIDDALRRHSPRVRVVGEESLRSVDTSQYPIAIVDPIDGTLPFRALGEGWASAIMVQEPRNGSDRLWIPAAAIGTSTGFLVGIWYEREVTVEKLIDPPYSRRVILDCHPPASGSLTLACVGAKPSDAKRFSTLIQALPGATVFNCGGNPVVVGVLVGELDAIVSFDRQANWDALYALAIALAGGAVGSADDEVVFDLPTVLAWFRQPPSGQSKGVPPIIAAKDVDTYRVIVRALYRQGAA